VLMLALRIAIAWTLLSFLFGACWVLLLQLGGRFGNKAGPEPSECEDRELTAHLRAVYGDSYAMPPNSRR
jgi:hypothetical protein